MSCSTCAGNNSPATSRSSGKMPARTSPRTQAWRAAAGAIAAAIALAASAPAAAAASTSKITGKLLNGTRGQPEVGAAVILRTYRSGVQASTRSAKTTTGGSFVFEGLEGGTPWSYLVTATVRDVEYQSARVEIAAGEAKALDLTVYDSSSSPAGVKTSRWTIWVDREKGGLAVQQDLALVNSGNATFIGEEPLPDGKRAVVRLPLAQGARDLQFLGLFMECCGLTRADSFVHTRLLYPGPSDATLRYRVKSLSALDFPVQFPTDSFELLVPVDMKVSSPELAAGGQVRDRNTTYQIYTASNLKPGQTLAVSLGAQGARVTTSPMLLLAAGVAGAAAVLLAALALRRRKVSRAAPDHRPSRVSKPVKSDTIRSDERPSGNVPTRVYPLSTKTAPPPTQLEEEDLLIEEIAALDLAFEKGFLGESAYGKLRALRKARLVELHSANTPELPDEPEVR